MITQASIIQEINQLLDGEALVRLFNYHVDKIQLNGPMLKCFCPIHHELAFRSLVVNLKEKNYKCTMKWCTAFEGGSLVALWALYRQMEPIEAAMELVELLHLPIDLETVKTLSATYATKATDALKAGELQEARQAIDQALALDLRNLEFKLLSALIWDQADEGAKAFEERLQVLDSLMESGRLDEARILLDGLTAVQASNRPLLERHVALTRLEQSPERLKAALVGLADYLVETGDTQSALGCLEEASQLDGDDLALLARLADACLEAGRLADALRLLEQLSNALEDAGQVDALLMVLGRRAALAPEDLAIQRRIAQELAKAGRPAEARAQWLALAEHHEALGEMAATQEILSGLLELDPRDVDILQRLAEFFVRRGDTRGAVGAFRQLAGLAQEVGEATEVGEFYERARRIDPHDLGLRRDQAEWKLKRGDLDGGLADLFNLADLYLEQGELDAGMAVLSRIATLAPGDLDKRLRIGRCLERSGRLDEAWLSYCQLARDFMRQQQFDAAQAICEEARRMRPADLETLELRIDTHLALKQKAEAIEACREVAREALALEKTQDAEAALLRGIKIDRIEPLARADLARLYEQTGRARQAADLWIETALFDRTGENDESACAAAREALRLDPENRQARILLAEGLEARGQLAEALDIWESLAGEGVLIDSASKEAYEMFRHALALAPRKRELLAQVAIMALRIEGAEAARDVFCRWLDTFNLEMNREQAVEAYRKAVDAYPEELGWRTRLVELLQDALAYEEAARHMEVLLGAFKARGEDDAVTMPILEQLVSIEPGRTDLREELAHALERQGHAREAANIFEELGLAYLDEGLIPAALAMLEQALKLRPEMDNVLETVAGLYEANGERGRAAEFYERLAELRRRQTSGPRCIQVIEKLLEYYPERIALKAELADLYEVDGDIERSVDTRFALAQHFAHEERRDEVIAHCVRIRALMPEFIPARELLVEGWLQTGETEKAKRELDEMGDMALASGKLEMAEACFKRIQEIDPEDIGANERLGKLYEARQRPDEAALAFGRVLDIYVRLSETAKAIVVLKKLRQLKSGDLNISLQLARMLLEQGGDGREAAEEWQGLLEQALERGETQLAESALAEGITHFGQVWLWRLEAVRLFTRAGRREFALRHWEYLAGDALAARDYEMAREAAGEGLLLDGENRSLREARIEANCNLASDETAIADLRHLAEHAAGEQDYARAEQYLRRALELQPRREEVIEELSEVLAASDRVTEACDLQRRLAELFRQSGRLALAIKRARRIAALKSGDDESRDFLAMLLAEDGQTAEAVALWREMADACASRGEMDAAIGRYARMLDAMPGDIDLLRRLADLTYETGGMIEAMGAYDRLIDALHGKDDSAALEAEFLRILDLEPGHLQMKERLADFLHAQGRDAEAREAFLSIIATYRDERQQLDDALRVMRHLKALAPEDLAVRGEEAVLLERAGRESEAAAMWRQIAAAHRRASQTAECAGAMARAAELENDGAEIQVETARLFGSLGDFDQAIHFFLRAIEIHDRHERLEECIPVLREAIELAPGRMELPDALARLYERLGRVDDALWQWLDLGDHFERDGCGTMARQIYMHIRSLLPGEIESRRRMAQLFEAEGDRTGALRELHELASLTGRELGPEAATEYLQRILSLDPGDEAAMMELCAAWREMERIDDLFATLGLLERFYSSSGRQGEALQMLEEMKLIKPGEPGLMGRAIDLLVKTGHAAEAAAQGEGLIQIYFDRGEDHQALETLRRIAEIEPGNIERRIALASLVHENGRQAEALQEFFLTATKLFGESQYAGCLAVCEAGLRLFTDELRLRDLMGRVLGRLGRQAEAVEVQLSLAALYDERGEEAKARRVYETILEDQPDHQGTLEAMVEWAMRHGRTGVAVDHLLRLAESHYLAGKLGEAIAAMERIHNMDQTRHEVRARLAEIYLESGDTEGAVRTWMEAARALAEAGRNELAIEVYDRVLTLHPEDLEVMAALAPLYASTGRTEAHERLAMQLGERYLREGRPADALPLFEDLARRYPNDLGSWEHLASLYDCVGRVDDAVEAYRHMYEIHRAQRRLEPARKCLEAALTLKPDACEMLEALGELCLALSRRPEGVAWLARAAQAMVAVGEHERARDLAQRILKLDPLNLEMRRLLADALEVTGDATAAMVEYEQAARGYADAGQNAPAIEILAHLLALDPRRLEERELYAKLLQREGRVQDSVDQYLRLLELADSGEDPRRPIKYCRLILAEQPDNPDAHARLCEIHERSEKWHPAFKECEWLAAHYLQLEDFAEAERYIMKGLGWFPDELNLRTRLIDLLIALDRRKEAGEQLTMLASMAEGRADTRMTEWAMAKACEIEPENLEHHCRLADYQERTGNQAGARQTRLGLIRLLLAGGRVDEARQMVDRLAVTPAGDRALCLELADLFEESGLDEDASEMLYELARHALAQEECEEARTMAHRALELAPRHTGAREALVEALIAKRELKEALAESEILYDLYEEASEWDGALRTLQTMIDLVPSRPEPRRRLVQLYGKMHREDAMIDQLRRLAEIYVNCGELGGAIDSLRELLGVRPDDTIGRTRYIDLYTQIGDENELREDYLILARIHTRKGQLVEATRAYEKVLALTPNDTVCREEFVAFLFDQGQIHRAVEETRALADLLERQQCDKEAGRVLDRALNYAPQELELRQRLAAVYMRTNRRGLALETFRNLARQFEHQGDEVRLLEVIEKIVELDHLNVEFRQRLADLMMRQGLQEEAFQQYTVLAEQYEERELYDLAEHEYRRMLTIHGDHIPTLEHLVEVHLKMGTAREIFLEMRRLAEHYTAQGRMRDTLRLCRLLLEQEPGGADFVERYLAEFDPASADQDSVDEFLTLADVYASHGSLNDAMHIYHRILEAQPGNVDAQAKLTETQRLSQQQTEVGAGYAREVVPAIGQSNKDNGNHGATSASGDDVVADVMRLAMAPLRQAQPINSLEKVIRNYENLVLLNPNNPAVHVKLAELLDQAGQRERADSSWSKAADAFMLKGEIKRSIEIYERCVQRCPGDTSLRDRLSRARLQQDSLRLIDGAINKL